MNFKFKTLLISGLLLCVFSCPCFATEDTTVTTAPVNTQETAVNAPDTSVPAADNTTPAADNNTTPAAETDTVPAASAQNSSTEAQASQPPVQQNSAMSGPVYVTANSASRDNCLTLNKEFAAGIINQFKASQKYPLEIDLTAFGEVDSLILPKELIVTIIGEEANPVNDTPAEPITPEKPAESQGEEASAEGEETADNTSETEADTAENTENTETTTVVNKETVPFKESKPEMTEARGAEQILKVTLSNKEYFWNRKTLLAMSDTSDAIKLTLISANQINSSEDKSASVRFETKDGKNSGILFIDKDIKGNWTTTGTHLFGSGAIYFFAIILLILITLAVIIAVNLLMIKIYKSKK